ncbi:unnamed protein product [Moneuplotes crassus]|uniref:VWFA domain-containing protein n=2 Tax=Euplotes crassus TaxID=5936 RepID=A0AAD1Y6X0_EUPCR|nr:unnamed protein product [Moneuplotes crassus]
MAKFASKKGYFPRHKRQKDANNEEAAENDDVVSVDSDSLDEDMSDSDEEEKQQIVRLRDLKDCKMDASTGINEKLPNGKKKFKRAVRKNRKFKEEVNTNIVSESFDVILEDAQLAAGDPVFCQNCQSVFNKYSKLAGKRAVSEISNEQSKEEDAKQDTKEEMPLEESLQKLSIPEEPQEEEEDQSQDLTESGTQEKEEAKDINEEEKEDLKYNENEEEEEETWQCEFCCHHNQVMLEEEEIPTEEYVHYVLGMDEDKIKKGTDSSSVIFCLDVSGSMCVTTPVKGKLKIKGDKLKELQELMKFSDGSDQFYSESRNSTYISRLQCVQAAIEAQIIEMADKSPELKVGLVSFSDEVTVHGDCSEQPQTIAGDKLSDYEFLAQNGVEATETHLQKSITEVSEKLTEKLYELEESGPTALGPALLTSVAMAAQGSAGSSVVLCTDGLSNVGLGSIEGKLQQEALEFYTKVADLAHENGVTVNIISIAGEECDLETLRCIPEKTGGDIQRVEADKLTENFANILASPIIATDVKMKVILHKGLEFKNEDESQLNHTKNIFTKSYGNVTAESEITFEYKIKSKEELKNSSDFDFEELTHLPFQTQIFYTKLDGMKCIRVNSHVQEISSNKEEVEAEVDAEMVGINIVQQAAKLAGKGDFRHAQAYMKCNAKYWGKNATNSTASKEVKSHLHKIKGVYGMLQDQNDKEELQKLEDQEEVKEISMMNELESSPRIMEKFDEEETSLSKDITNEREDSDEDFCDGKDEKEEIGGKGYKSKLNDEITSKFHNMNKYSRKRKMI